MLRWGCYEEEAGIADFVRKDELIDVCILSLRKTDAIDRELPNSCDSHR